MHAFQAPAGKCLLRQRRSASCAGAACIVPPTSRRNAVTEWHSSVCAPPAASASAPVLEDWHYAAPSPITTRAEFEHQYRHHMATQNRYCRYGDVEFYAPSEEGAAAILKAVAEPLVRCQRWLRLGNSLRHIVLYELLKVFAGLGGDRELVLAGSDELDALASLKACPSRMHMDSGTKSHRNGSVAVPGSSNGNGNGNDSSSPNGNTVGHLMKLKSSSSKGHVEFVHYSNGSCRRSTMNGNGGHHNNGYNGNGKHHPPQVPPATPFKSSPPPPSPGFLLLRTSHKDRGSALFESTADDLLGSLASGAASPLLLVEMHEGDDSSSCRNGVAGSNDNDGGTTSSCTSSSSAEWQSSFRCSQSGRGWDGCLEDNGAVTAAKYRLWGRMMKAALHTKVSIPAGGGGGAAGAGRYGRVRGSGYSATQTNGDDNGNDSRGVFLQDRPIVVWGLLTDLKRWRFYCVREVPRAGSGGDATTKFEILGSRRLRVVDEPTATWPGLVPALAALYAITCTSDGLAVRRPGDASKALAYDIPHDPHRDRLMHFHLIMGAPKPPLYGAVAEWVRRRMDEYVLSRREQKYLRQASEAAVQQAAAKAAAEAANGTSKEAAAEVTPTASAAPLPVIVTAAAATTRKMVIGASTPSRSLEVAAPPAAAAAAARLEAAVRDAVCPSSRRSSQSGSERESSGPGIEAIDEEGEGGLPPAAMAAAAEAAKYYEGRLAAAKRQVTAARERATQLRRRALALSPPQRPGGDKEEEAEAASRKGLTAK